MPKEYMGHGLMGLTDGPAEWRTDWLTARLRRLRACGCEVRAHEKSRLHAKVLLTEQAVVLGSCNFTSASLANAERGVLLRGLSEEELIGQRQWYEQLWEAAAPFRDGIGEVVPPSPER